MAIIYEDSSVTLRSVIYEDEVVPFRDFLQEKAGGEVKIDMSECDDIHLAILQLIMAYQKNYGCIYEFGSQKKLYQIVLEGFDTSENHCN